MAAKTPPKKKPPKKPPPKPPASFAHDIAPMFRPGDVACMAPKGVKLSDAGWMTDPAGDDDYPDHAHARMVFDALSQQVMPPDGPWAPAKIAVFQHWMDAGFKP
jgi:hypothetical protein